MKNKPSKSLDLLKETAEHLEAMYILFGHLCPLDGQKILSDLIARAGREISTDEAS